MTTKVDEMAKLRETVPLPCPVCKRSHEELPDEEVKTFSCFWCGRLLPVRVPWRQAP